MISLPKDTYPNVPEGSGNGVSCYTIPPEGEYVTQRTTNMANHGIPEEAPLVGKEQPTKYVMPDGRQVSID